MRSISIRCRLTVLVRASVITKLPAASSVQHEAMREISCVKEFIEIFSCVWLITCELACPLAVGCLKCLMPWRACHSALHNACRNLCVYLMQSGPTPFLAVQAKGRRCAEHHHLRHTNMWSTILPDVQTCRASIYQPTEVHCIIIPDTPTFRAPSFQTHRHVVHKDPRRTDLPNISISDTKTCGLPTSK